MRKILLIVFMCTFCLEVIHADVEWTLSEDGTLTISGGEMEDYNDIQKPAPWFVYIYPHRDKIKNIVIEEGVTNIGNYAFDGLCYVISVTIPNSVTSIGHYAFASCTNLTSVTIPNSVTTIGNSSFSGCMALTSITIPNSVTSIGETAFHCTGLTSMTIPNSVTSIGLGAFASCTSLTSVTIPNSVTTIEYDTFVNCPSLTSISIPSSVTYIEHGAFANCPGLTSVTIPSSMTNMEYKVFAGCSSLTTLICYAVEPPTGEWTYTRETERNWFTNVPTSIGTLYVPASSISAYKNAEGWKEWKNIKAIEDGVTTGLRNVVDGKTADERMYNLKGQRINGLNAQKGIYIKNGKKYAR